MIIVSLKNRLMTSILHYYNINRRFTQHIQIFSTCMTLYLQFMAFNFECDHIQLFFNFYIEKKFRIERLNRNCFRRESLIVFDASYNESLFIPFPEWKKSKCRWRRRPHIFRHNYYFASVFFSVFTTADCSHMNCLYPPPL